MPAGTSLAPTLEEARKHITRIAADILSGSILAQPTPSGGSLPCQFCEFGEVCRFDPQIHTAGGATERTGGNG
jgi:ATP-dependent helicase/DNAse subunit B